MILPKLPLKELEENFSIFDSNTVVSVMPTKSCFFCKHTTDIWTDYTHGPYMSICQVVLDDDDKNITEQYGQKICENFELSEQFLPFTVENLIKVIKEHNKRLYGAEDEGMEENWEEETRRFFYKR